MNDAQLQVLTDQLHEMEEPEDAEQLALWLKYPGAVRWMMQRFSCSCDTYMGAHRPGCWTMEAMRVLKHPLYRLQLERQLGLVNRDHAYALIENARRQMTPEQRAEASRRDSAAVSVFLHGVIRSPLGGDVYEAEVTTEAQRQQRLVEAGWPTAVLGPEPGSDQEMFLQQDVEQAERDAAERRRRENHARAFP